MDEIASCSMVRDAAFRSLDLEHAVLESHPRLFPTRVAVERLAKSSRAGLKETRAERTVSVTMKADTGGGETRERGNGKGGEVRAIHGVHDVRALRGNRDAVLSVGLQGRVR